MPLSSRAERGAGLTFEVQQLTKQYLCGGLEAKAFSRRVVVCRDASVERFAVDVLEVGFAWKEAAKPTNRVLDRALLPRAMCVAEEGFDAELVDQQLVASELGAVVEGDGVAHSRVEGFEPGDQPLGSREGSLSGLLGGQQGARLAFQRDENGLARRSEQHEVRFPVPEALPPLDLCGPLSNGNTAFD